MYLLVWALAATLSILGATAIQLDRAWRRVALGSGWRMYRGCCLQASVSAGLRPFGRRRSLGSRWCMYRGCCLQASVSAGLQHFGRRRSLG